MPLFEALTDTNYVIPKAQILFTPEGSTEYELLGDADDVSLEMNVEETERYSNEEGTRKLALTIVTQVDPVLSLTLVQFTDRNRALALLGQLEYATQAAAPGETFTISDVVAGKLYKLPHINLDNVVITDGEMAPVNYVEGTHYRVDTVQGIVQIIAKPGGSGTDAVVEYDALAVVSGDLKAKIGVGSAPSAKGAIIIRGTNDVGKQVSLYLHRVQLRPSGGRSYISDTDLATIELEGRVFIDSTQPAGYEVGYELAN